ncbi:tyrosyl-trna synthetase [Holotrichia oblita]|nr:tyrosyl-trna synthetase [Holotrichia oblita]
MVGDPTDRTDMRQMMSPEQIRHNVECFKKQLSKFIDLSGDKAIMADNADWLLELKYVPFIREYGVHFSVNKMLTADAYRTRFERGLSFFEFNYMLMQSYDFLELYRRYDCKMQLGGNDQWSNILGGVELIRRAENGSAYGLTMTLLTTSEGKKMGKSQSGAVWLDPEKTSPYDFYQYWRNVDDADVVNCLKLLTYIPLEEIEKLSKLEGSEINKAKEILAFSVTEIVHSTKDAEEAQAAARSLFGGKQDSDSIPSTDVEASYFENGMGIIELLELTKLIPTRSEGRRLIQQGGVKIGDIKVDSSDMVITKQHFNNDCLLIQKGKKGFHKIKLV